MVYPKVSGEEITRRGKKHFEFLRTQIQTAEAMLNRFNRAIADLEAVIEYLGQ